MSAAFSIVAIIAAYNEADVIGPVVGDLIEQGIEVYFLDDGSTDRTIEAVEPFLGRGLQAIERLEAEGDAGDRRFDWERILRRKAALAAQLDASWFIHHDADEFRESPWPTRSLRDAIRHVDERGYNAIDFVGFDFWPTGEPFRAGDDVRSAFPFCSELAPHDRLQIRCWKKTPAIDLASSGGHEATFEGRRVFPLPFILRHYPIRGQQHGERKVFQERRSRFVERERQRGWHVQYDALREGGSFLRDQSTLSRFDADGVRAALPLRAVEKLEHAMAVGERRLEAAGGEIARLNDEIIRRESDIALKDGEIDRRGLELARLAGEIGRREDEIAARDAVIASREACIGELRTQAERLSSELTELHRSTRAVLDTHVSELNALGAENRRLLAALEQRAADTERWRVAVEGLTRQLDALHRSLSWRLTAPLRAAYRLLGGR